MQWLGEIKKKRKKDGRHVLNKGQFAMVKMVVERILEEAKELGEKGCIKSEPMRWLLHGGPGTGKSHVIKIIHEELFQNILKWNMSIEYQIVALQAVMAEQLQGDTVHHALGIPVFHKKHARVQGEEQRQEEVAKRVLQWRWLIIDEISMISAKLFGLIDEKLRDVVRNIGTNKSDETGVRPFGGLNVLCVGDFWQLEPPDGGFLGAIPTDFIAAARKYAAGAGIAHGQSLIWGGNAFGLQGITELTECERCDDPWLREVQEEIRNGKLSPNNHAFLHGRRTTVPGSWCNGKAQCNNADCQQLAKKGKNIKKNEECDDCTKERELRKLVAMKKNDARFKQEPFATAPGIFANNDIKYEINKLRAKEYAEHSNESITYSAAKDTPTADALKEKPDLPYDKLNWLQRHDRESGDLYGMLPLIRGMPVALTDHIDRSQEKNLLRGRRGYIHSWVLDNEEAKETKFIDGQRVLHKLPMGVIVPCEKILERAFGM